MASIWSIENCQHLVLSRTCKEIGSRGYLDIQCTSWRWVTYLQIFPSIFWVSRYFAMIGIWTNGAAALPKEDLIAIGGLDEDGNLTNKKFTWKTLQQGVATWVTVSLFLCSTSIEFGSFSATLSPHSILLYKVLIVFLVLLWVRSLILYLMRVDKSGSYMVDSQVHDDRLSPHAADPVCIFY